MAGMDADGRTTLLSTVEACVSPLDATVPASAEAVHERRRIGRYELVRQLGAGGMGVVWEAIDPELDRGVAIKLLRDAASVRHGDRLRREAQALAQLHHPNVIAIYDVGGDDGELYIVMQLVEGATLDRVLASRTLSRDEIIALVVQAGRGLAAAHSADIVHRDFKPSNVLVDNDGVVRVSDFGLARVDEAGGAGTGGGLLDVSLTRGDLVGTPAYMAPEQFLGGPVTQATDQFAFCVTLWEALAGVRPFAGTTLDEIREAVVAGRHGELPAKVPRRVRAALLRGLAVDFKDRFPRMDDLLAELAPRRRTWWLVGGLGVTAIAGAVAVIGMQRQPAAVDPCAGIDDRLLAGTWDGATRERLHEAFLRTGNGNAEDVVGRVGTVLDRYAADWIAMRRSACEATERREQSQELLDRQMFCLDGRAAELGGLVRVLGEARRAATVDHALDDALRLTPLAACADRAALLDQVPLPADPIRRARATAVQAVIADAERVADGGDPARGVARLEAAIAEARELDYAPLLGRAVLALAALENQRGNPSRAPDLIYEATEASARGHDDAGVARGWLQLVLVRRKQRELEPALAIEPFARVAVARASDPTLPAELEWTFGLVARELGRLDEADRRFRAAFAALPRGDTARRADFLVSHALMLRGMGKHQEALDELVEATAIYEQTYGPASYKFALGLYNASRQYRELGRCEEARQTAERSLAISERNMGADNPELALDWQSLGDTAVTCLHDVALARRAYERAVALSAAQGPAARARASSSYGIGMLLLDRAAEAEPLLARAVELAEPTKDPVVIVVARQYLGLARVALGKHAAGAPLLEAAAATYTEMNAKPNLLDTLVGLADARAGLGQQVRAIEPLERALALAREVMPSRVADIELALARALWAARRDRSRARTLAEDAARAYAAAGADQAARRAEAEAWLAAHR